tara:strand:+ start:254 stop:538 length:285 start_codon:yes stop_codon:yes gene_type:complete
MKEMIDAARQINKILHECEDNGDSVDVTLDKISTVKVHGCVFSTMMLLEIMHKFLDGFEEREKGRWNKNYIETDEEQEIQNKYSDVAGKWNKVN